PAAQEAGDPSTSPERLLELTEKHPQLQRLIVLNPSCPEVARQWILATNPWAKQAYDARGEAGEAGEASEAAPEEPSDAAEPPTAEESDHEEDPAEVRSEEHTSELQSRFDLVCRLLLEKKKHTQRH